tara:strand:- start:291 stop:866 length:576 start_codon:yes stop_codon:yes gene_type:complete
MNLKHYSKVIDLKKNALEHLKNEDLFDKINNSVKLISNSVRQKGKLLIIGNGGSAADSQHMATELVGKYLKIRKPFPAIALTTDTSILTSISNDMDFNKIFTRQIDAIKTPKDIIFAITTSGKSKNIIDALKFSKKNKLKSVCLTSKEAPKSLERMCDIVIRVPEFRVDRIQELHIFIEHLICEELEKLIK